MPINETKDKAALERLVFMGLMKDECTVNEEAMPVFAGIFAGLFYWDVLNHFGDDKQAAQTMTIFQALQPIKEYHNMYLFLSLMYDRIKKPLPDPVWLLSCSPEAIEGFMTCFAAYLTEISGGDNSAPVELEEKK